MKKWLKVVIICIAILAVLAGVVFGYYFAFMHPYRGTVNNSGFADSLPLDTVLTGEQAREDLFFMMECLESRHPAWLEEESEIPQLVQAQFDKELEAIGEETTVLELYQAASRITSVMRDGHTWVRWRGEDKYVDDVTQFTDSENTVIAINGEPLVDIYNRFLGLFQYELEPYARATFANVLIRENYLRLMGVDTADGVTFTFESENGQQFDEHYTFVPAEEIKGNDSNADEDYKWVSYEIDAENSVAIFTLNECIYNDEYCAVVEEFFGEVEKNNVENIVVDLRENGGGNSMVADEFLRYLDIDQYNGWGSDIRFGWYVLRNRDIVCKNDRTGTDFDGKVYVLTATETFSAAMDFAMLIGDNDIGVIVGEASGNRPDAYGDCLYFQMPNSKLGMSVSYKRWYRIDQDKVWQPLEPDYYVYAEEALDKVYELIEQ